MSQPCGVGNPRSLLMKYAEPCATPKPAVAWLGYVIPSHRRELTGIAASNTTATTVLTQNIQPSLRRGRDMCAW